MQNPGTASFAQLSSLSESFKTQSSPNRAICPLTRIQAAFSAPLGAGLPHKDVFHMERCSCSRELDAKPSCLVSGREEQVPTQTHRQGRALQPTVSMRLQEAVWPWCIFSFFPETVRAGIIEPFHKLD